MGSISKLTEILDRLNVLFASTVCDFEAAKLSIERLVRLVRTRAIGQHRSCRANYWSDDN